MIGGEVLALTGITASSQDTTTYDSQDPLTADTGTTDDRSNSPRIIVGSVLMLAGLVGTIVGSLRIRARPDKIVNRYNMEMVYTQR